MNVSDSGVISPDPWTTAWDGPWNQQDGVADVVATKAAPPDEDPDLRNVFSRHQVWTDNLVAQFERALKPMVDAATERTVARLKSELSITDDAIDPTAANDSVLASADAVFMAELNAEGYQDLLKKYTGSFDDQLPYLQDMFTAIGKSIGQDLPPVKFAPTDLKVLDRIEATTVGKLDRLFAGAAGVAMDRVLFSVAGLPFEQLVATVATQMDKTMTSARTWADTAVSSWYRTASSLQFSDIQAETPKALRFRYSGPEDIKTRSFCEALLMADKTFTREEIDAMDNGQLPNVFVTCGGYNCRHIFVLAKT